MPHIHPLRIDAPAMSEPIAPETLQATDSNNGSSQDNTLEEVACDFCGSDAREVLYTVADWGGLPVPEGSRLVRCRECGLVYLSPRPTPEQIGDYYTPDYTPYRPAVGTEPNPLVRWIRRRKLAQRRGWIEKISGLTGGRILDVGCSTGLFLNEMKNAGWDPTGIELTPRVAAYARDTFGLEVITGTLPAAVQDLQPGSFDVITYWDVLEHTFSPGEELRHSADLLKPGGLLAINIPNWESPDRDLFGPYWIGLDPPRHLYVFPRKNLLAYLEKFGFEEISTRGIMTSYFSFIISLENRMKAKAPGWAGRVSRLLNFPGVRYLFEPYFTLADRAGKGGIITTFARKI